MLERWNPFAEFDRLMSAMNQVMETTGQSRGFARMAGFRPPVDIYDTGTQLIVRALLPGAKPEHIDVTIEQNTVTFQGRFGYELEESEAKHLTWYRREIGVGQFTESVNLPVPVETEQVQATIEDGILTLTLPKAEQVRAKRIAVSTPKALTDSLH